MATLPAGEITASTSIDHIGAEDSIITARGAAKDIIFGSVRLSSFCVLGHTNVNRGIFAVSRDGCGGFRIPVRFSQGPVAGAAVNTLIFERGAVQWAYGLFDADVEAGGCARAVSGSSSALISCWSSLKNYSTRDCQRQSLVRWQRRRPFFLHIRRSRMSFGHSLRLQRRNVLRYRSLGWLQVERGS